MYVLPVTVGIAIWEAVLSLGESYRVVIVIFSVLEVGLSGMSDHGCVDVV